MSDSDASMDYQSEDGEIKIQKSPLGKDKHNDGLPFSLSDEDAEDTTDSLDIKPPQANVHSIKSRSHREKRSHRDKERRAFASGHPSHARAEERPHKKGHHRSREERHRERREERHREREKRHHRDKHGVPAEAKKERLEYGVDELRHKDDSAYRNHREDKQDTNRSYRDVLEGRRGDTRDVHSSRELRDPRDPRDIREVREIREVRDPREFRDIREREKERMEKRDEQSRDRSHKEKTALGDRRPDDLRDRILDRRRDGESHHHERERHKRERREAHLQLEHRHQQQLEQQRHQLVLQEQILPSIKETPQERAEREERECRRLKLLEAASLTEREMVRQKEVYKRELEARRARRQVEEEKERALENIAIKRERSRSRERRQLVGDDSEVVLSEASDDDEIQDEDLDLVRGPKRSADSGSGGSVASSSSSSGGDESDDTGSERRVSEGDEDPVQRKNGTEDGHKAENGNISTPPPARPADDGLEQLPPYYPAIQGCRSVEEFVCINRIEEGTYGVVYRAKEKRTGEIVALKRLKMEKEKEGFPITSLREINTLLKAQHKNIVTVREIVVGSNMDKIFIVMDYVAHDLKSLMETMRHKKQVFLPGEVKCLMQQLLSAVHHLHDNWILHRDLKTSNLLLSHEGVLKVGDFGLAREYGSPLKSYTPIVVTLWYRSPELLLGAKEYSTPVDIWSVGCIYAEFLLMEALFPGKSEMDQLNRLFKELGTPNEDIWPGYNQLPLVQKCNFSDYPISNLRTKFATMLTELGIDLLNKFLTYDPVQRITADEALAHSYFKEVPLAIDPAMFPTWPAKSELVHRKAASPKPPSGGKAYKQLGDGDDDIAAIGFHMGTTQMERTRLGAGFSLKF
ncbi:hypothetical protein ONE63_008660 [Megalurothrips usitatus]|uniref:cyclin-dependent kinase n=1 Tax=Megalurothrips usitatus TaxID=439358 RepID=A0AAV7XLV8_9NEOP|nr:hypothetical protein ONE63_008660 [Megalurothrips usitatus]